VSQRQAEDMTRLLAKKEGIFCGVSSGGATYVALELSKRLDNATIVVVVCDRGDRYISTGIFPG
jgi:cysteine synthase B